MLSIVEKETNVPAADAKRAALESFMNFANGGGAPAYPLQVFLEASNLCDLKCVMCVQFSSINRNRQAIISGIDRQFLDIESFEQLEDILRHALVVHLHGGGEPTLHPNFTQAIETLGAYDIMVEFFTNAMHLTDDLIDVLVKNRVHKITVSWSGATADDYEHVYHGGVFSKLADGLFRLRDHKERVGAKYPLVCVNSIAYRHHLEKLDRFTQVAADLGVSTIFVKPLNEWGHAAPELVGHAGFITPGETAATADRALAIAAARGVELHIEPFVYANSEADLEVKRRTVSNLPASEYDAPRKTVPISEFKAVASLLRRDDFAKYDRATIREQTRAALDVKGATVEEAAAFLGIERLDASSQGGEQFYCMEPFKTLYVEANGRTKPCCNMPVYAPAFGRIGEATGTEIWQGSGFQAARDGILRGEYPKAGCEHCLWSRSGPADHWADTLAVHYDLWYMAKHGHSLFGVHPYELSGKSGAAIAALYR